MSGSCAAPQLHRAGSKRPTAPKDPRHPQDPGPPRGVSEESVQTTPPDPGRAQGRTEAASDTTEACKPARDGVRTPPPPQQAPHILIPASQKADASYYLPPPSPVMAFPHLQRQSRPSARNPTLTCPPTSPSLLPRCPGPGRGDRK